MKAKKVRTKDTQPRTKPHTTRKGVTIQLVGVSPSLLQTIRSAYEINHPEPIKPQYEIEAAGGELIYEDHDETTLSTDKEKAEWEAYITSHKEWEQGQNRQIMEAFVLEGTEFEIDMEGAWVRRRKRQNIEIPKDPDDLKIHYFETQIVGPPEDTLDVVSEIMQLTGIDEKAVDNIRKLFRTNLQR